MPVILARAVTPPEAGEVAANQPYPMSWTGWDGSLWDLTKTKGPLIVQNGVVGLHEPRFNRSVSESSALPGNLLRSTRAQARQVAWPLLFRSDSIQEWQATYGAFFDSVDPDEVGTWRVGSGLNERTLQLTGLFDSDYPFEFDPFTFGWAEFVVTFEAAQPYWAGLPVVAGPWQASEGVSFFPGPPFHLGSSATLTDAEITNPGNTAASVTWALEGPIDAGAKVGVSGKLITIPFAIAAGTTLVIRTDPRERATSLLTDAPIASDPATGHEFDWAQTGVSKNRELGYQPVGAVPRGATAPLSIIMSGTGRVAARLVPLYRRAFANA